jgi:hypothetical protein
MPALTELIIHGNTQFGDSHAKALAKCPELARLTSLDVGRTGVNAEGVAALVSGKHAGPLTVLDVSVSAELQYDVEHGYSIRQGANREEGVAVAEALAASKALTKLQELNLNYRDIGDEGLKALVGAKAFPALRRLNLGACGLTLAGAKALAGSALGGQLLYVNLGENSNLVKHAAKLKKMFPNAFVQEPFEYVD